LRDNRPMAARYISASELPTQCRRCDPDQTEDQQQGGGSGVTARPLDNLPMCDVIGLAALSLAGEQGFRSPTLQEPGAPAEGEAFELSR
jgi:hypothetical protein